MKIKTKFKQIIFYVLGAFLVVGGVVLADIINKLLPTGSPSSPSTNMVTLEDIYKKTQDFTYTKPSSHDISTSSLPSNSMNTLQDIWDSLTLNPVSSSTILTSNTIMGIAGNVTLPSESDVRKYTVYGSSDVNSPNYKTGGLVVSSGLAPLQWSAQASVGLCWDTDPNGFGYGVYCAINSGLLAIPNTSYVPQSCISNASFDCSGSWDNTKTGCEGQDASCVYTPASGAVGAVEYCKHLNTAGTTLTNSIGIWSLPTEAQLMSALANEFTPGGSPIGAFQDNTRYWSGSESDSSSAWSGNDYFGYLGYLIDYKFNQYSVICVH
ncbi:MAG: hypothetical protein NTV98_06150 [Candidatus Roizmanbacteria bacterium]|nr:hypothetical protein [Candidatus Roizmanbacteria bacterium]